MPEACVRRQGIAPRYGDFIKSLVWAYKLSPETMQLAATDSVKEIEVMDLAVKDKCSGLRSLAAAVSALDKIIPSPLIFRVFDEEGRALKIAFNLKTSGGMATCPDESLRDLDTRHYRAESLRADLADIEKKISRETQLDRKYALAKEKQRIERELGRVVL